MGIGLFVCALAILVLRDRPHRETKRMLIADSARHIAVLCAIHFGDIGSVVGYCRYSWEVASVSLVAGRSRCASRHGPSWQFALAVVTVVGLVLGLPLVADCPKALIPGLMPATIVGFFVFKHAMVRQDGHAVSFQVKIALAGLFLFVCAKTAKDRRAVMLFQACSLFLGAHIVVEIFPSFGRHFNDCLALRHAQRVVGQLWNWPQTREDLNRQSQASLLSLRLSELFHREVNEGTVEAVPWDVTDVRANGWKWRPRPVFQTYAAYTPDHYCPVNDSRTGGN